MSAWQDYGSHSGDCFLALQNYRAHCTVSFHTARASPRAKWAFVSRADQSRAAVRSLVLREGPTLVVAGIAIGLVLTGGRNLRHWRVFGSRHRHRPADVPNGVSNVLVHRARRMLPASALRVDPMIALRHERNPE
jgi:hypothetical protein